MKNRDYLLNHEEYEKLKEQRNQSFNGMSASEWAKHSRSVWKDLPTLKEDSRLKRMVILPVELIDRIVNIYSKEEDKILDPFMGSGTTVISAIRNNRFCYGFEIDSKVHKIASDNIENSLNLLVNGGYVIRNVDCVQGLNSIEDESIQLTITSPSIPSNKYVDDYNGEFDKLPYDPYLERMSYVMNELYRVTKMGGYVAFVVTDYRNIKYDEPYVELHSDIARVGKDAGFLYQDCIIYDHNDQRGLLSQGYPKIFYANLNHTYVVILRKAR